MRKGIESVYKEIGSEGCYFFCLLHICGVSENFILRWYDKLIEKGLMTTDCYIKDAPGIIKAITGETVKFSKTETRPEDKENRYIINEWYNPRTKYTHFAMDNFDPLTSSVTEKEGYIRSYRVIEF